MFGTHRHAIKRYPFLLVAFIASFVLFGWSIAWYFQKVSVLGLDDTPIRYRLYCSMGLEALTLLLWAKVDEIRTNLSIVRCQDFLGEKEDKISELKRMWLEREVGLPKNEYLMIARSIDEAVGLSSRYRSKLSLGKSDFARYIFCGDSKNRILAMLMGAVAVFTALSISNGASIETVFAEFEEFGAWRYLKFVVAFSLFIFFLGILARQALMALAIISEVAFDGKNSKRLASNFINEILNHYNFVSEDSEQDEVTYENISKFARKGRPGKRIRISRRC